MPKSSTFKEQDMKITGHLSSLLALQDPAYWQTPLAHELETIWHDNCEGSRHMSHWINQMTTIFPTRQSTFKEKLPWFLTVTAQAQQQIQLALVFSHTHCCSREVGSRDKANDFSTILVGHSKVSSGDKKPHIYTSIHLLHKMTAF